MTLRLVLASVLLCLAGAPGLHAQHSLSPDLCGTEATALMQQLDGVWAFEQGTGVALGSATIPFKRFSGMTNGLASMILPAQSAVDLEMAYAPRWGFSILSGQGQAMLMVPADAERAGEELDYQLEQIGESSDGPQCASGSLPVLVGTNTYELDPDAIAPDGDPRDGLASAVFCADDPAFQFLYAVNSFEGSASDEPLPSDDFSCVPEETPDEGEMRMTIILEFASPTSGSGFIYYQGSMEGDEDIEFSALAPVTVTR